MKCQLLSHRLKYSLTHKAHDSSQRQVCNSIQTSKFLLSMLFLEGNVHAGADSEMCEGAENLFILKFVYRPQKLPYTWQFDILSLANMCFLPPAAVILPPPPPPFSCTDAALKNRRQQNNEKNCNYQNYNISFQSPLLLPIYLAAAPDKSKNSSYSYKRLLL